MDYRKRYATAALMVLAFLLVQVEVIIFVALFRATR